MKSAPVELVDVSKSFGVEGQLQVALDRISLRAECGELHLLLGPSGSGKTTLLTLIAGLQPPDSGSIRLFGKELDGCSPGRLQRLRARSIGFVFQDFQLIDSLTVTQNIALVLRFAGASWRKALERAQELLHRFGLTSLQQRQPQRLSQGEKQRVAIIRAVANDAPLVLADEPTASLESQQGMEIIGLLKDLARAQGRCVIVASHDLRWQSYADHVWHLHDGRLTETPCRSLTNRDMAA
jgi:putative ABC transport system ATP-binding protein